IGLGRLGAARGSGVSFSSRPGVMPHQRAPMNDVAVAKKLPVTRPTHKVRFVTAASLFDGHDASINIMRRILQATGCEVIHLGHNRSVEDIVTTALQEDA